ncbi:uncharacterized protein LOC120012560 [Tripterygium wilfordii]|uniref:uncharacterized protein LOC120012560 n=1 Tax=Tripterygium wilfordii TaxID=458696 RepID=UPI0018F7FBD7|nr:uncharacterized protein LOC120012560 [Tripterygium wilfordii]
MRSGYFRAQEILNRDLASTSGSSPLANFYKGLWQLQVPPSTKSFIWRASHGILRTYSNLCHRKIILSELCPLCNQVAEDVIHAIFFCPHAVEAFGYSCKSIQKLDNLGYEFIDAWFSVSASLDLVSLASPVVMLKMIWFRRNSLIHGEKVSSVSHLFLFVSESVQRFKSDSLCDRGLGPSIFFVAQRWCLPCRGVVKINFDAYVCTKNKVTGFGGIFRNDLGFPLAALTDWCPVAHSPTLAEAYSALTAVQLAKVMGFQAIHIDGDSLNVINAIGDDQKSEVYSD